MKFCPYCGNYNNNINGNFCEHCGGSLRNNNVPNYNYPNKIQEGNTFGWGILGFFVPLAGLVLFIAWHNDRPKAAKSSGIGALVRVVVNVLLFILICAFFVITDPNYRERERINYPNTTWERRYEEDWT